MFHIEKLVSLLKKADVPTTNQPLKFFCKIIFSCYIILCGRSQAQCLWSLSFQPLYNLAPVSSTHKYICFIHEDILQSAMHALLASSSEQRIPRDNFFTIIIIVFAVHLPSSPHPPKQQQNDGHTLVLVIARDGA